MIEEALIAMAATSSLGFFFFVYKFIKALHSYFQTVTTCKKKGVCIVRDLKDSRVVYGNNGLVTGRVYYYNVVLEEDTNKVLLYTEKISGNKKSKLKENERIKVWINSTYNYTVDYNEKIRDIRTNAIGSLVLMLFTVLCIVIGFLVAYGL